MPWADGPGVVEFPDGRRIRGRGLRRGCLTVSVRSSACTSWRGIPARSTGPTAGCAGPTSALRRRRRTPSRRWRRPTSARSGERVEIACGGGVGRTGTALAAIAVMAGVPGAEAVDWVRARYDDRAVETPWQRRWVLRVERGLYGGSGAPPPRRRGEPDPTGGPIDRLDLAARVQPGSGLDVPGPGRLVRPPRRPPLGRRRKATDEGVDLVEGHLDGAVTGPAQVREQAVVLPHLDSVPGAATRPPGGRGGRDRASRA